MSLFRRKPRSAAATAPVNEYEEAEANPELIAAEAQVNQLPSSTRLVNPSLDTSAEPPEDDKESPKEEDPSGN